MATAETKLSRLRQGVAVLDFGTAAAHTVDTRVDVVAVNITSTASIHAWLQCDSTTDHSADEHMMASDMITLVCSSPHPGTGFTLYGLVNDGTMSGAFNVHWRWR